MRKPVATFALTVNALWLCRSFMMLDNRVIVCVLLKDSLIVFCGEWSADPLTSSPRRNAADMCLFKPPVSLVGGGRPAPIGPAFGHAAV